MRYFTIIKPAALMLSLGLAACEQTPKTAATELAQFTEQGRLIAEQNCTSCHSIETSGDSPRSDAPPLRTISARYNLEALADDFREHLHVGHPDMPDFDFNVKETEALLTYLRSIQETPSK